MSDWDLLKKREDYDKLVEDTYKEGEYGGDPPERYPCMALAEVDQHTQQHYFYYVYVKDASKLLSEYYEQRQAEEGEYIDFENHTTHILKVARAANGFILVGEEHYQDEDGVPMVASSTRVATKEKDFIDMFAGYASTYFMREGFSMLMHVIKPKEEEEHEVLL